jgi:ribosomal protein L17
MLTALNKKQENKMSMYEAVTSLLDANSTIISTLAALVDIKDEFGSLIVQIKSKGSEKRDSTKGKVQTKNEAEDALVNKLLEIGAPLYSYARRTKNNTLIEICNISETGLKRLRDTELESKANSIHAGANEHIADLGDYGITAAAVTDLSNLINSFHLALGDRESSAAVKTGATKTLAELFKQADDVLYNSMDMLIENYRMTQTDFYQKYLAARVIKDIGVRHDEEEPTPPPPTP